MLDTKDYKVKQVRCDKQLPITRFCWFAKNRAVCQTQNAIVEFRLVEDESQEFFRFEPQKNRFNVDH